MKLPSICFVVPKAWGALTGQGGHMGGAERQAAMSARWLSARGFPISFVSWDEGQADGEAIDKITVFKTCRVSAGLPGLRFFWPRTTGLFAAMTRANADIYYHTMAEHTTGLAAYWCRNHARRFIFSVASDADCLPELIALPRWHERWLYRKGIQWADQVFTQTSRQRELLQKWHGRDSQTLPLPCDFPVTETIPTPSSDGPPHVAWIGRLAKVKRLELLLDVAALAPEVKFEVVVPNLDTAPADPELASYAPQLIRRAGSMSNIIWRGRVSADELQAVYARSICLCCTSLYEGFPNTFLEAWCKGRPVISTFDPDGLIAAKGLGTYGSTADELTAAIRRLAADQALWRQQSQATATYFRQTHALDVAMQRFEKAFLALN